MVDRRHRGWALGIVLVVLLAACGSNDYRYVNNSSEGTFFKVPSDWKLYRVKPEDVSDRPAAPQGASPWHVVFDSSGAPAVEHADEERPDVPVGQALIFEIAADQGDQLSPADLRVAFLGDDPLDSTASDVEVVSFEPLTTKSGLRGSHVVFNHQTTDGQWVTTDHSSLINAAGTKVYVFEVKADSKAFKADAEQIQQIVDSWQVKL
jgi:hypothetical protein